MTLGVYAKLLDDSIIQAVGQRCPSEARGAKVDTVVQEVGDGKGIISSVIYNL
jgi:hypothetical protein